MNPLKIVYNVDSDILVDNRQQHMKFPLIKQDPM